MPITPRKSHIDKALTGFSLAYMQSAEQFVAWQVFANFPVEHESDRYWTFPREYFYTEGFRESGPGTPAGEVTYDVDNSPTYLCRTWKERHAILHKLKSNADTAVNPELMATKMLSRHAMIKLEKDWCAAFFRPSIWSNDYTGVAGAPGSATQLRQWDNYADSDPIEDVEKLKIAQLEKTGYEPDEMVLGRRVWGRLKNHPDIVDRIKYGQTPGSPAVVTEQAVAALMGLKKIYIAGATNNTTKQGKTPSYSFIAGNHALLVHAPKTIGEGEPIAGVKFSWTREAPGTNEQGGAIRRWEDPSTETEYLEMKMSYTFNVIAPDLATFIGTAVAS